MDVPKALKQHTRCTRGMVRSMRRRRRFSQRLQPDDMAERPDAWSTHSDVIVARRPRVDIRHWHDTCREEAAVPGDPGARSRRLRSYAMASATAHRRLPVGAEALPGGGVHFRVWAPRRRRVAVVFEGGPDAVELAAEGDGYFSGHAAPPAPALSTAAASTTTRTCTPTRSRASSRRGRTGRPK